MRTFVIRSQVGSRQADGTELGVPTSCPGPPPSQTRPRLLPAPARLRLAFLPAHEGPPAGLGTGCPPLGEALRLPELCWCGSPHALPPLCCAVTPGPGPAGTPHKCQHARGGPGEPGPDPAGVRVARAAPDGLPVAAEAQWGLPASASTLPPGSPPKSTTGP